MNNLSIFSFIFGLLGIIDLLVMFVSPTTLDFLGQFSMIIFYLPALSIIFGGLSFMYKLNKKDLILSLIGLISGALLYSYFIYTIVQISKSLA